MINLYDNETDKMIGTINLKQLKFLVEQLEVESLEDQDYYINRTTLDAFGAGGADLQLMEILRQGLGDRDEMEIRWEHS
jgi:processive 1,2-diacylglycerol beta-glucosyltransferase